MAQIGGSPPIIDRDVFDLEAASRMQKNQKQQPMHPHEQRMHSFTILGSSVFVFPLLFFRFWGVLGHFWPGAAKTKILSSRGLPKKQPPCFLVLIVPAMGPTPFGRVDPDRETESSPGASGPLHAPGEALRQAPAELLMSRGAQPPGTSALKGTCRCRLLRLLPGPSKFPEKI